jgi:hypothetical protein
VKVYIASIKIPYDRIISLANEGMRYAEIGCPISVGAQGKDKVLAIQAAGHELSKLQSDDSK